MTKNNKEKLLRFERKGLRKIYRHAKNSNNGEYEYRKNLDIGKLFNRTNSQNCFISKTIKQVEYAW